MNVGLDTSVVIRLLIGEPVAQAAAAQAFLSELDRKGDQPIVCDLVVAEAYFALQHHFAASKGDALYALAKLFESGEIQASGSAARILKHPGLASAKPGLVDRMIHALYVNENGAMATFEKAAAKLGDVRLL